MSKWIVKDFLVFVLLWNEVKVSLFRAWARETLSPAFKPTWRARLEKLPEAVSIFGKRTGFLWESRRGG